MTQQALTNDSFLNLLEELRNELDSISTTNAMTTNVEGIDDIDESVTKCFEIVDTLATDLVAQQDHKSAGFTHVSKALPVNTLNNDVLYLGINPEGFACVFNYLSTINLPHQKTNHYTCHYITGDERQQQMNGLLWWKILTLPTNSDIFHEGELASFAEKPLTANPYPLHSQEAKQWKQGWLYRA